VGHLQGAALATRAHRDTFLKVSGFVLVWALPLGFTEAGASTANGGPGSAGGPSLLSRSGSVAHRRGVQGRGGRGGRARGGS